MPSGEAPNARAATKPAALTGTTGTNEESAAATMDRQGDSRSAAPQDNRSRIPYAGGKPHLSITEDVDAYICLGVTNLFSRITLPPTPDHKELRPEEQDPPGRTGNVSRARFATDGGPLYFDQQQREKARDGTSDEVRKQVIEAHRAGPVPPPPRS
eukprot:8285983-Pyramimonas_sp.AAC.1